VYLCVLFITETECVYCAVRTECVRIINVNCISKISLERLSMTSYVDVQAQVRPTLTPALHWLAVSLILRFINPRCNNPGTQGTGRWWNSNRSGRSQEHCTSAPIWNGTPTPHLAGSIIAVWTTAVSHTVQNQTANQTRNAFRRHDSKEAAQWKSDHFLI